MFQSGEGGRKSETVPKSPLFLSPPPRSKNPFSPTSSPFPPSSVFRGFASPSPTLAPHHFKKSWSHETRESPHTHSMLFLFFLKKKSKIQYDVFLYYRFATFFYKKVNDLFLVRILRLYPQHVPFPFFLFCLFLFLPAPQQ